MKNIIIILITFCSLNISKAQSKKEIIQELTIENTNLKQDIATLNYKITSLNAEIASLKKELTVDKIETPQDYGKTLFDLFVSQRLSKYPELQFQLKDTIYLKAKDVETMKESIKKIQKNSLDFYLEGLNNGIDWSKVKYENFEFEINEPNGDIDINHLSGKFYFNYSGIKYSFKNEASILENGKWRGYSFNDLVNETEELEIQKKEKKERLNEPYKPYGVDFKGIIYKSDNKEMFDIKLSIQNNTDYVIEWIKFQLQFYDNKDLIFSKNIILSNDANDFDNKLEPGENEIVKLTDINEVFINSGVDNKKWEWKVKLLEAKPKPLED
jgi:hypothetical protein